MDDQFFAVRQLLEASGIAHEIIEHPPIRTAEDGARTRNIPQDHGVKSLIFKADQNFVLVLVRGDRIANWPKLRTALGAANVRLATPEEAIALTGCAFGSIHPFAALYARHVKTFMDRTILEKERVSFSIGLHTMSCTMRAHDLLTLTKAEIIDV